MPILIQDAIAQSHKGWQVITNNYQAKARDRIIVPDSVYTFALPLNPESGDTVEVIVPAGIEQGFQFDRELLFNGISGTVVKIICSFATTFTYVSDEIGWTTYQPSNVALYGDSLNLSFQGANNSTVFTDLSSYHHSVSVFGNTKISTDQFLEGSSSAYFDGSGDYLSISNHPSLQFGTGNGTIDLNVFVTGSVTPGAPMAICGTAVGGSSDNAGLFLAVHNSRFIFRHWVSGATTATSASTISPNTWYRVKAVKEGNVLGVYVNDVRGSDGSTSSNNTSNSFTIGRVPSNDNYAVDFQGYMQFLKVKQR